MKIKPLFTLMLLFSSLFPVTGKAQDLRELYLDAMRTSVYPDSVKIDTNLVAITPQNPKLTWKTINGKPHILVATWKSVSYYPNGGDSIYNTGSYPIWVTASPQLKEWFKKQPHVKDTNLRLKQLLGLPPTGTNYTLFAEFWVQPSDLFRPCPDNAIDDKSCSLCFPANTSPAYIKWFNESRISRYYQCQLYDQYPWTQLGYTYDWNPENSKHIGMSEFVIKENSTIYVKQISSTKAYLAK